MARLSSAITLPPSASPNDANNPAAADADAAASPSPAPAVASPASSTSPTSPAVDSQSPAPPTRSSTAASIASENSAQTVTPATKRSRLWPRLSLPRLSSSKKNNRYLADFHISPTDPHRHYGAGDHVHGTVDLTVVKPVRITHLVVTLHGYVHVVRDPTAATKLGNTTGGVPRGGGSGPQYHGNGFASLFQDEQVLSGEGRLEIGKYQFEFDLVFPSSGLPSGIDFERGTISYLITATLTRPNAIAPITTCDRKILFVASQDVSDVAPPSPAVMWLEPTSRSKKSRRKRSTALDKSTVASPDVAEMGSEVDPMDSAETPVREPHSETRTIDQSDVRSEVSGESGRSVSTGLSRTELAQLSQSTTNMTSAAKQREVNDNTISATVETSRGGYLAGDTVPVRISIRHHKYVKSMSGIIITLYRLCRINVAPTDGQFNAPMSNEPYDPFTGDDEITPRSRTGLGGLSLSSTGSTMVFRKDLDQNIAPLIIDPNTMSAALTVSLKLPDDSFPTISGVPGGMMSFTYHVEAILDLGGKMANSYQSPHTFRTGPLGSGATDATNASYGPRRGATIADTSHIRRINGIYTCGLTITLGTTDSNKSKKKGKSPAKPQDVDADQRSNDLNRISSHISEHPDDSYFPSQTNGHHQYGNGSPVAEPPRPAYHEVDGIATVASPAYIPAPHVPSEESMTEKERIRQAETRLLPSQPGQPTSQPSAPPPEASSSNAPVGDDNNDDDDDIYEANTPRLENLSLHQSNGHSTGEGPSAPTADDIAAPIANGEDKQEVERQRLMGEASAPMEFPEDVDRTPEGPSAPSAAPVDLEPTAPVLDEEDGYAGYGARAGPAAAATAAAESSRHAEQLPAYER